MIKTGSDTSLRGQVDGGPEQIRFASPPRLEDGRVCGGTIPKGSTGVMAVGELETA